MEARVSILALSINWTAYAEPSYKVICESEEMWKEVYGVKVHLMQYTSNPTSCLEDPRKNHKSWIENTVYRKSAIHMSW